LLRVQFCQIGSPLPCQRGPKGILRHRNRLRASSSPDALSASYSLLDKTYSISFYILLSNLAVSKGVTGVTIDNHGFPEFYDARKIG